ncbi:MAG: exodeoxyribonuclease III [Anaerolineae bacterium]
MTHLKIATLNANSIRVRLDQILDWMDREQADVVCVQETKVQDKDFPREPIEEAGYHVAFAGKKAHAGVATVSRTAPETVQAGFDDGDERARFLYTVIEGLHIANSYVPQGREPDHEEFQHKLDWFAQIKAWFDRHFTPQDPVLWLGDLNVATEDIDVYDPQGLRGHVDFHPDAQAALEDVRQWGFVDLFRKHHPDEPNRFTYYDYRARNAIERNVGWRIDHIWATKPLAEHCVDAWIDVEARKANRPSDHTFLVAEFEF